MISQRSTTTLEERRILLGITGGIAAYKAAELARLLVRAGAQVQVVMTEAATEFVGPLTFQALTGRPVRRALFDEAHEAAMGHIELARWADLILIAPATANCLAKISQGLADDLLTTLCLATTAPIAVAPAMNQQMWRNRTTVEIVSRLVAQGVHLWGPDTGGQACGDTGPGRMLEPEDLLQRTQLQLLGGRLNGVRAVVTAGPTREAIDPVRFLGNRSSGKMGFALAQALSDQGAEVTLVAGPVSEPTPRGVWRIDVESATEMYQQVMQQLSADGRVDLFVACAAVADYRPVRPYAQKLKKTSHDLQLDLVRNPDILADVAALPDAPFTLGFAAETERLAEQAELKRQAKGVDMIAANLVAKGLPGFDTEDNRLLVLFGGRDGEASQQVELALQPKTTLARQLVSLIGERLDAQVAVKDPG